MNKKWDCILLRCSLARWCCGWMVPGEKLLASYSCCNRLLGMNDLDENANRNMSLSSWYAVVVVCTRRVYPSKSSNQIPLTFKWYLRYLWCYVSKISGQNLIWRAIPIDVNEQARKRTNQRRRRRAVNWGNVSLVYCQPPTQSH